MTIKNGYSGSSGGGISAEGARIELVDCVFEGNRSVFDGGAVYVSNQPASFTRCVFNNNTTGYHGGAVSASYAAFTFTNCQFSRNRSEGLGGAIYSQLDNRNYPTTLNFTNCSFSANEAGQQGGAAWVKMIHDSDQIHFTNCILWNNAAPEGAQIYELPQKPVSVSHSLVAGGHNGAGNLDKDPLFAAPDTNNLHLQPGSPAIDSGTGDNAPGNDLDGQPRPIGSGFDMGAYEYQTPPEPPYEEGEFNYYLPYYSSIDHWTGIGVTNANPNQETRLQAIIYSPSGTVIGRESHSLSPQGQASFASGDGLNATGWIRINSHDPLYGLAFIGGTGNNGQENLMADISFVSQPANCLVIPHIAQSDKWDTEIYVCNPNPGKTEISLTYIDKQGVAQKTVTRKLAEWGSGRYPLGLVFAGLGELEGQVKISSSNQKIAAFALYHNQKEGGLYYAGIDADSCR